MTKQPIKRIRKPGDKWTPADIGLHAPIRPSMFAARTGIGLYSHAMPPMTRDGEHLQTALLVNPTRKTSWAKTLAVCAVAVAVLMLIAAVRL